MKLINNGLIKKFTAAVLCASLIISAYSASYADEIESESGLSKSIESETEMSNEIKQEAETKEKTSVEEKTSDSTDVKASPEPSETLEGTVENDLSKAEGSILYLDRSELYVYTAQTYGTYRLTAYTYPETDLKVKWSSDNEDVAKVSSKGIIIPKKAGTAYISAEMDGASAKCRVIVTNAEVDISKTRMHVYSGSTIKLFAYSTPDTDNITWESSDTKILTVDQDGNVTAKGRGTAKIYAYAGRKKASCKITVYSNKYKLNRTSVRVLRGKNQEIKINSVPENSYVSCSIEDDSIASVCGYEDNSCTIAGNAEGITYAIISFSRDVNGKTIEWRRRCRIQVAEKGISKQQFAMAAGTDEQLKLARTGKSNLVKNISWKSSNADIASVDASTGMVHAKSTGKVKITASVAYKSGAVKRYTTCIRVSSPRINMTRTCATIGKTRKINISGRTSWSRTSTFTSSNSSVATVDSNGKIYTVGKGHAYIKVNVDGKKLGCHVYVSDPELDSYNAILAPGWQSTVAVNGLHNYSAISYSSDNGAIASVNSQGVVTAGAYGTTYITALADGVMLRYLVEVAPERAIRACDKVNWMHANWTYSQQLRMNDGYYDCSSAVFKAYGCDAALLGGTSSWAPTAANMAKYMQDTGKVLTYSNPIPAEQLRPGDIYFQADDTDGGNGRFMNIYHVEMYRGGAVGEFGGGNIVMIARPLNE